VILNVKKRHRWWDPRPRCFEL